MEKGNETSTRNTQNEVDILLSLIANDQQFIKELLSGLDEKTLKKTALCAMKKSNMEKGAIIRRLKINNSAFYRCKC